MCKTKVCTYEVPISHASRTYDEGKIGLKDGFAAICTSSTTTRRPAPPAAESIAEVDRFLAEHSEAGLPRSVS